MEKLAVVNPNPLYLRNFVQVAVGITYTLRQRCLCTVGLGPIMQIMRDDFTAQYSELFYA